MYPDFSKGLAFTSLMNGIADLRHTEVCVCGGGFWGVYWGGSVYQYGSCAKAGVSCCCCKDRNVPKCNRIAGLTTAKKWKCSVKVLVNSVHGSTPGMNVGTWLLRNAPNANKVRCVSWMPAVSPPPPRRMIPPLSHSTFLWPAGSPTASHIHLSHMLYGVDACQFRM